MRKPDDPTASTDSPADSRSFYGRWSRRKRQARDGVAPADDPPLRGAVPTEPLPGTPPVARSGEPPTDDPDTPGERVLTDADMPPLESLGEDDDYSGFMSPGVSEGLRNLALRKLFRSSRYNVVDGLDDYADDFTHFEPLGDIITSDMRHQMEVQAEREKRRAEEKARALLDDESGLAEEAGVAREVGPQETEEEQEPEEESVPDREAVAAPEAATGPGASPDEDPENPRDV